MSQLWLFDESQPGCAHCGEPLPAFDDKKYCDKECRDSHNRIIRKDLAAGADRVPTSLYKYYDRDGVLLYVGITSRGSARNTEHNKSKSWWQFVERQDVEHHRSRASATQRETSLIRRFAPPFNKQQNPDYETAKSAYLTRQSIGGEKGVKLLIEGRNRVPGFVVNKVGERVTIMVNDPQIVFIDAHAIRVDSGGREAKFVDSGVFSDGSGSWARVRTVKPEQVTGAIVMYKHTNSAEFPVKMIKLVYQDDVINVWSSNRRKRAS